MTPPNPIGPTLNVQSYGGGLNSAALAVGLWEHGERVDLRLFADVGAEWPETYEHMRWMRNWLLGMNLVGIDWVKEERFTLEEECLAAHTLPSIVLGMRSCSDKFKIRPQNRFMRIYQPAIDLWASGGKVTKLVGFDAGEAHRIKDYSDTRYNVRFPLVEWGWDREDCIACLERNNVPVPRKSSCFYCPEMKWQEIKELRDTHPKLMERALVMEAGNEKMHTAKGLARSMSWKDALVQIDIGKIDELPKRRQQLPCTCTI